jgi:glycine/sarcosine N-methyltransferase
MKMDRYAGFAGRYDLFFAEAEGPDLVRVEFFRRLFQQHKTRRLLDCACGTGRDLLMFSQLGLEICGSDISAAMLRQARRNLTGTAEPIPLDKVDFRRLPEHFSQRFDVVACLSTAILEMPDEANVLEAFRSMHGVLNKGGLLILTQGTTDKQWREKPRFIPAVNTPEFSRIFAIDYFEKGARYHILDIFHSAKKHDFKTWSIDFPHILLRDDFERLLKAAGFSRLNFWGNFTGEPYKKTTSDHLIIIARK